MQVNLSKVVCGHTVVIRTTWGRSCSGAASFYLPRQCWAVTSTWASYPQCLCGSCLITSVVFLYLRARQWKDGERTQRIRTTSSKHRCSGHWNSNSYHLLVVLVQGNICAKILGAQCRILSPLPLSHAPLSDKALSGNKCGTERVHQFLGESFLHFSKMVFSSFLHALFLSNKNV